MTDTDAARRAWLCRRTWGRGLCRLLQLVGVGLLILGLTGWWLATRVLSDNGFADVVVKTVQQPAVRVYIADRVTVSLAPSSKFLTVARPLATSVIAEAIDNPVVTNVIYDLVAGIHHQVFEIGGSEIRSDVSAASAAATIKSVLQSIDPKLADRIPDNLLLVSTGLTTSDAIDLAAHASPWVEALYIPVGVVGIGLIILVLVKARDPVHATRFVGLTMLIAGALPIGLGFATPVFAAVGANEDPGRGAAVAAFVHVLLGRLVAAGWAVSVIGLLLALVPGRDGASLTERWNRARVWIARARTRPPVQILAGLIVVALGVAVLTVPRDLFLVLAYAVAVVAAFCGLVLMLRAMRIITKREDQPRLRTRQFGTVLAVTVVCAALTTTATALVVDNANTRGRADPRADGCNGSIDLCFQPLNQIMWPAVHNAMSSIDYNSFTAENTLSIPEQLNAGATALLIDAYYGYPQSGIIRTNLTGGASRQDILRNFGPDALTEVNRLGALTGSIDTSGQHNDVYLCHILCELGAVKASDVFSQINDFLDTNLTDVIMLDVEDYVRPADLKAALEEGGLWNRVYTVDPRKPLPTLAQMVTSPPGQDENPRRLIVVSENNAHKVPWLTGAYDLMQETPYTFKSISDFNCDQNRGSPDNPMFLLNHWLRESGPPDPVSAAGVNSTAVLTHRIEQCIAERHRLPNVIAVDFYGLGDTYEVCQTFNAAVAAVTGTEAFERNLVHNLISTGGTTESDAVEIQQWPRLPAMSLTRARELLGPVANELKPPAVVVKAHLVPPPAPPTQSGTTTPSGSSSSSSGTPSSSPRSPSPSSSASR